MVSRMIRVSLWLTTLLCAGACSNPVVEAASDEGLASSKADWGEVPDVDWANQFFLTQLYDPQWNPTGVVDDTESNNCGS
jgi:hypothetical protein